MNSEVGQQANQRPFGLIVNLFDVTSCKTVLPAVANESFAWLFEKVSCPTSSDWVFPTSHTYK